MPKLVASLLTLLVALLYGVGAVACPGGVAMQQGDVCDVAVCAAPSEHVCAGRAEHGGYEGGRIHAHQDGAKQLHTSVMSNCQTCVETECCGADHQDSQLVTLSMARERWMPVLCAVVKVYEQAHTLKVGPVTRPGPAQCSGVRASDLALFESTYLLI